MLHRCSRACHSRLISTLSIYHGEVLVWCLTCAEESLEKCDFMLKLIIIQFKESKKPQVIRDCGNARINPTANCAALLIISEE